jgi:hypothetical protein
MGSRIAVATVLSGGVLHGKWQRLKESFFFREIQMSWRDRYFSRVMMIK